MQTFSEKSEIWIFSGILFRTFLASSDQVVSGEYPFCYLRNRFDILQPYVLCLESVSCEMIFSIKKSNVEFFTEFYLEIFCRLLMKACLRYISFVIG